MSVARNGKDLATIHVRVIDFTMCSHVLQGAKWCPNETKRSYDFLKKNLLSNLKKFMQKFFFSSTPKIFWDNFFP